MKDKREITVTDYGSCYDDDDVVITGISGRFPMADNVEEFKENLYSKKDCIIKADHRWSTDTPGCPDNHIAAMKDLSKFDADFFSVAVATTNTEDAQNRIMLEVCYEAIVDAGYGKEELAGKRIGVFVGMSDPDPIAIERNIGGILGKKSAVGYIACMIANKVSHKFDFIGPSYAIDTACSSSGAALEEAFHRIRMGDVEAAVVGATSVCLDPRCNASYLAMGILSPTGVSRPYDANANGLVKGESVSVIFIQKKRDARRLYSRILNVECYSAGFVNEGIFFSSMAAEISLFKKTFENIGLDPLAVGYIEGHGTGTPHGDPTEVNAIDAVFTKGRKSPLLLGGIKSNIGHSEAASGICSIAKIILAFESGVIAPNINFDNPNPKCTALLEGRIKVITEPTPLPTPIVAVNNFGFGGVNVQIVMERSKLEKRDNAQEEKEATHSIPKLIVYAASTEKALTDMFDNFYQNPKPREFYALLNNSAYIPTMTASYRGFTILHDKEPPITMVEHIPPFKRQVWYVFTGMGCQWRGMGLDLMKLDIFAESMRKSAKILERFGIDLLELLRPDKDYLEQDRRITPAFVTISSIQIALVDVLNTLGLKPDGIIGHSTGELVSSYADGCCTAEETILSAYYRGAAVEKSNLPPGAMAAVGLSWEDTKKRCPKGVYPACDNAGDSVTISGEKEAVEKFVEQLTSENIFARIVNAYGYAFHCESVGLASQELQASLKKVYTNPKQRTKRWFSSSYSPSDWNTPGCQLIDVNYFCHNLISEVHFREAMAMIPPDAITIEIGPHFLLQSILKRSIGNKASFIGLMKRNHDNNVDFLLSAIGQLYNLGLDPQVEKLYPPVSYPVPRGTPMISPLIQWDHSQTFYVPKYSALLVGKTRLHAKTSSIDSYLLDHCIDGRSLYPATGYVYLAWKALSDTLRKPMETLPIIIEDFRILRAVILTDKDDKSFEVSILTVCGEFEILERDSVVATGKIFTPTKPMFEAQKFHYSSEEFDVVIPGRDMYNELKIHGYEYGPAFQGLLEFNMEGSDGLVKWNDQWISFLDSLLLFFGIIYGNEDFKLPTGARCIKIDPKVLLDFVASMADKDLKGIPVKYDKNIGQCCTPGVEIRNLKLEAATRRPLTDVVPVLEEYRFVPYNEENALISEQMIECENYVEACCYQARKAAIRTDRDLNVQKLLHNAELHENIDVEKYYGTSEEKYPLLETICSILQLSQSQRSPSKISFACENFVTALSKDLLFGAIFWEVPMRSLLDVVVENSFGKIGFIEWCDNMQAVLPSVQKILKYFGHVKTSCTLIHPQRATVDAQELSGMNIMVEQAGDDNDIPAAFKNTGDLVLTSFLLNDKEAHKTRIRQVKALAKEKGFILAIHKQKLTLPETFVSALSKKPFVLCSEAEIEKEFLDENLVIVSKKKTPYGVCAYLLRKVRKDIQQSQNHVVRVLDGQYNQWVDKLKDSMALVQERDSAGIVWLIAQDSPSNGMVGMVNCLKQEPGGDRIRCVFTYGTAPDFDFRNPFYEDVLKKDLLMNIYKDNCWGSFRHKSVCEEKSMQLSDFAYVECTKLGDLSSFRWLENPVKYVPSLGADSELYHVYYSSVNFKDVMLATGKISVNTFRESGFKLDFFLLGIEFSGRDANGRRIMAMTDGGSFCNAYIGRPLYVHEIPDKWTMEEAATIPVVYSTCYYALIIEGRLQTGEKVLIHSGTGGVGQAAIRIALSMNCEIFTTVGTPEKRELLVKIFPQIKPENIGCSRDTTFEDMVMTQTDGKGVDVVLNSLADDKFQASVRCLGQHGRFLEIGKYDLQLNKSLGLNLFLKDTSFHGIMLDTYFNRSPKSIELFQKIHKLFDDGIKRGVVQPLNTTVFPVQEVEEAFRYMATGKHTGKVVLKVREEETEKTAVPKPVKMSCFRNFSLYPNKSYIIIGGLGGFGIELAKWLLEKAAGAVILTSRFGARTPYHHFCLKRWASTGARVVVSTLNVAHKEEAKKLLEKTSSEYGPIGGIFNSAVVLRDAFIDNQSASDFEEVSAPKALATKNLDELSRTMCPELDMFVCFSSISCGKGNAGQTNYGYANSVMERICEQRKEDGLPGLAVQWGIIGDVGLVHRNMGDDAMISGVMAQKIKSCLRSLEEFLLQDTPVVSSFVTADRSRLAKRSDNVLAQLAKMFNVPDIDQMNPYRTFGEMGIDSMVGVEMKQMLESAFDMSLSLQQIQDMKIDDVKRLVEERNRNKDGQSTQTKQLKSITIPKVLLPTEVVAPLNGCKEGIPIFVVYGNDVTFRKHKELWEGVTRPVYALQSTTDMPITSLTDMAIWHLKNLFKACAGSPVHLVSVSTSANLALEMLLQSQREKTTQLSFKSWTILDGSLELMEIHTTTEQEKKKNEGSYETADFCQFLSDISDADLSGLKAELQLLPSLESRLHLISSLITSPEKQEFTEGVEFFVKKQHLLRSHIPAGKINQDLTVIEASEKVLPNDVSGVKSFVSTICSGHIKIHRIPGNYEFLTGAQSTTEVATLLNKLHEK